MGKVIGLVLAAAGIIAVGATITTWWAMLLFGAVHINVSAAVPAFGFFQTLWIILLLGSLGAAFNSTVTTQLSKIAKR